MLKLQIWTIVKLCRVRCDSFLHIKESCIMSWFLALNHIRVKSICDMKLAHIRKRSGGCVLGSGHSGSASSCSSRSDGPSRSESHCWELSESDEETEVELEEDEKSVQLSSETDSNGSQEWDTENAVSYNV